MLSRITRALRTTGYALALSAWAFASARAVAPGPNQWDWDRTWYCSTTTCEQWYGIAPGYHTYPTGATASCPLEFMTDGWWLDADVGTYCAAE